MLRTVAAAAALAVALGAQVCAAQTPYGAMVPIGTPSSLPNLAYFAVPLGTLQHDYDTYAPVAGYIAQGSSGAPITTNGATFAITRYQNYASGACASNPNDTECDAALNVLAYGGTTDNMVLSGINVSAVGQSTVVGANIQALNCQGFVVGSGVGIAGCGFMLGRRDTNTGLSQGIEISSFNNTSTDCVIAYGTAATAGGLGDCDGIWLSARGFSASFTESSAVHVGLGNSTGQWKEGMTLNRGSVSGTGFNDQSNSTSSFVSSGTHTNAFWTNSTVTQVLDAHGATISGNLVYGPSSTMTGAGKLVLGQNATLAIKGVTAQFESFGTVASGADGMIGQYTADANGPALRFYKSRATTIGAFAAVQASDIVGGLTFQGDDGAAAQNVAVIQASVTGTVSSGIVPGVLNLRTSNTSGTLTTALSLGSNGSIFVGSAGTTKIADASGNLFAVALAASGAVTLPGLASSSAATTGTLCWTTGTGNVTVDTTVACLASLEELKDIRAPISGREALNEVMALRPVWGRWKSDTAQFAGDAAEQPFLTAHQVESVDPRLVGYGSDGALRGVRYMEMSAIETAAIQELQAQIIELRKSR